MKKYLLLLTISMVAFLANSDAQCTPDAALNHTGFSPANLPPAYTDAPYSQTLSFYAVKDTTYLVNGNYYDVVIDSVQLMSLSGIPAGFTYNCLNRCVIAGGQAGCALLSGSADTTQIGGYPITTHIQTYFHLKIAPTSTFNRFDSSSSFTFRIYRTTGLGELLNNSAPAFIKAYPNPTASSVSFALSALPNHSQGAVSMFDALGRKVYEGNFSNNNTEAINVQGFDRGIYKCLIQCQTGNYYTTFIKE